jgi:hypothetical protein
MNIILFISFIVIAATGIVKREEVILSIRSGSMILKIGVFTLITGIIILIAGGILGFGEIEIMNQIISICFLVTFLCLTVGVFKFISLTSFSFNRKIGIFSLITGFAFALMTQILPFFYTYAAVTYLFYIVAVCSLIVEVYKFIFGSPVLMKGKLREPSQKE